MKIQPLLQMRSSLTIFIAPPAWGKTSLLLELDAPWIFVSPLRALAEEFAQRLTQLNRKVRILRKRNDHAWVEFAKNPQGILVATPETLPSHLPAKVISECVLVLDEFHLFQTWGEEFRPLLREQLYAWANLGARILGLSATIEVDQMSEIKAWLAHGFDFIFIIDLGNMRFKNAPEKIYRYGKNLLAMKRRIYWESKVTRSKGIIFCKTRHQVKHWIHWFSSQRLNALACVGGQVEGFRLELENNQNVQWIITTSALSHGVNLPSFDHVFIDHRPNLESMWIQMAARGGRKGEKFYLHCMDKSQIAEKIKIWCFDVLVRTHLYLKM